MPPSKAKVTRVGITRRLQALRALGWSTMQIARLTGLYPDTVRRITNDPTAPIHPTTARRIVTAYGRAAHHVPPDSRTHQVQQLRRDAYGRGWAPPYAWDRIDDPQEAAKGVRDPDEHASIAAVDEALLLLRLGVLPEQAAQRLGVQQASLARRLRRAGETRWARVMERQP